MPSGRTHDRITLWTLPLVVLLALRLTLSLRLTATIAVAYLFGGWMFGPDLDIHSVQYKRWGWLRWIWLPYRGRIKHRSRLSHGPIIGTILRVLYFFCWVALAGVFVIDLLNGSGRTALSWGDILAGMGWGLHTYWRWWVALLVGLEAGALSHYASDWLTSEWKAAQRQGAGRRSPRGSRKRRSGKRRRR
jgi:uncharacterized metal-binding protein